MTNQGSSLLDVSSRTKILQPLHFNLVLLISKLFFVGFVVVAFFTLLEFLKNCLETLLLAAKGPFFSLFLTRRHKNGLLCPFGMSF